MDQNLFNQLLAKEIKQMCQFALIEDLAETANTATDHFSFDNIDITAELIPEECIANATLITREDGILCGTEWVEQIFKQLSKLSGNRVQLKWKFQDGDNIESGQIICELSGNARQMLTGERSAMNFLQTLSATATLTKQYIDVMKSNTCQLLDTRKTIPGMRFGQKYAVTCGGGTNHRLGLSDAFLIKENHIMACGGIAQALKQAITNHPGKLLEIEVESIDELQQALEGKAQVIMLDNFSVDDLKLAREMTDEHNTPAKLEASGNVNLATIAEIAETGVDYISVGALTKNVKALDLSLRVQLK